YGLDDTQAEYLMEMKIRSITTDRAAKALKELDDVRDRIAYSNKVLSSEVERKTIIFNELQDIIDKYAKNNKTILVPELKEEDTKVPEVKVSDEITTVILTNNGFIKRLTSTNDIMNKYKTTTGDYEVARWTIRNNQHILVFDRFGTVHKILVDNIDSGRGKLVDKLHEKAGIEKAEDIIWADACGDYDKYFNLIYPNGKGVRIYYADAKPEGNRLSYRLGYSEVKPGQYWITTENQFFMVTHRMKAAYCDISRLGLISNRTAFKIARLSSGDWFTKIVYLKDVPNVGLINLDKYNKDYTVSIGNDILWVDDEAIEEAKRLRAEAMEKYKPVENAEETSEANADTPN
ncbi:MAG: hypothetical protein J6A59_10955, partial [Lachnospiraceae bacterium]|nr:hypothetical protein [Lachnospiraceae bacterium]